jgi:hypothetical protein
MEALGSTCIVAWASRSHGTAADAGEQSLQAVGVLGPDFHRILRGCSSLALLLTQESKVCGQWEF